MEALVQIPNEEVDRDFIGLGIVPSRVGDSNLFPVRSE